MSRTTKDLTPLGTKLLHTVFVLGNYQRKKRVYTTTAGPLFSRSVARPRGHRAKKAMVYTMFLGKQGKRVYTIGPERRVYTIEPQTRKKKKRRVSTVVVYTFFFPELFLVVITGNFTASYSWGINYCNVMIGALLSWKPRIFWLQLQFLSLCCVGINYCNVMPFLYRFYFSMCI